MTVCINLCAFLARRVGGPMRGHFLSKIQEIRVWAPSLIEINLKGPKTREIRAWGA